jgi:hypothetical protein
MAKQTEESMAKQTEGKYSVMVGARVTPELAQKLADMARATHRDQAGVLRLLLTHAQVLRPDIQSPVVRVGTGEADDA